MAKGIRKVDYYVLHTNDQPGEGAHLLKTLKKHKVNLLALTAFPTGGGSQVDLIPEKPQQLIDLAKKFGWKLSSKKTGFMARGKDRAHPMAVAIGSGADAGGGVDAGVTGMSTITRPRASC